MILRLALTTAVMIAVYHSPDLGRLFVVALASFALGRLLFWTVTGS